MWEGIGVFLVVLSLITDIFTDIIDFKKENEIMPIVLDDDLIWLLERDIERRK